MTNSQTIMTIMGWIMLSASLGIIVLIEILAWRYRHTHNERIPIRNVLMK